MGLTHTHTAIHINKITNKDLLNSTGNSTQYCAITYMGKESGKIYIYIYTLLFKYILIHIHIY